MSSTRSSPHVQRAYDLGEELRSQGTSLEERIRVAIVTPLSNRTEQEREIVSLHQALNHLAIPETPNENLLTPEERGSPRTMDHFQVSAIQDQVASLRVEPGRIGNRGAVQAEALRSGLVANARERLTRARYYIRHWEIIRTSAVPRQAELEAEFQVRVRRGEINPDQVDGEAVRNLGPDTNVADISSPVTTFDQIRGKQCPICIEEFNGVEDVVRLACSHFVHAQCMHSWVNSTAENCNKCVSCRRELFERRPRAPIEDVSGDRFLVEYRAMRRVMSLARQQLEHLREDEESLEEVLLEIDSSFSRESSS